MNILAVIPARKGSSLKWKNIRPVGGLPMVEHTMQAVAGNHTDVLVSTNDTNVKALAFKYGFDVHDRSRELANDTATLNDVMIHIAKKFPEYDAFACYPPTAPCRGNGVVKLAVEKFNNSKCDSLVGMSEEYRSVWTHEEESSAYLRPLRKVEVNRQEAKPLYVTNGSLYIVTREALLRFKTLKAGRVLPFVMTERESVDVHTEWDIKHAEFCLKGE